MLIGQIYSIFNTKTKKRFIGRSFHTEDRIKAHFRIKDRHPLHFDIQTQGKDKFQVEIHYTVIGEEKDKVKLNQKLKQIQETLIIRYQTRDPNKGYNIWSKDMYMGVDEFIKRIPKPQPNRRAMRVAQYDMEGNFIKEYSSIKEASDLLGLSITTLYNVVNGIRPSCKLKKNHRIYHFTFKKVEQ